MSTEREKRNTSQPESYRDFDRSGRTSNDKGEGEDFVDYFAPSEDPVLGSEAKSKRKTRAKSKSVETEEDTLVEVTALVPGKEIHDKIQTEKNLKETEHVGVQSGVTVGAGALEQVALAPKTPKKTNKKKNTMSSTDFNKLLNSGTTLDALSDEQLARLSEEQFNLLLDGERDIQEQLERDRIIRARRHQQMLAKENRMRVETELRMAEQKQEEELLLAQENRLRLEAEARLSEQKRREEFLLLQQQRIRIEQESRTANARLVDSELSEVEANRTTQIRSEPPQKFQFIRPNLVSSSEQDTRMNRSSSRSSGSKKNNASSGRGTGLSQSDTEMNLDRLFGGPEETRMDLSESAKRLAEDENLYDCSVTGVKSLQQHGLWMHGKHTETGAAQDVTDRGRSLVRTTPPYGISRQKHGEDTMARSFDSDPASSQKRENPGELKDEKIKSGITEKAEASVRRKLTWPQKNLGFKFIQEPLGFNQLTFEHLIVGEITTIRNCQNILEAKHRMRLLERIGYWRLRGADWSQIRAFYAAIIAGIEAEEFQWDVSFADIESMIIDKPLVAAAVKPDKKATGKSRKSEIIWFCRDFNSDLGCEQDSGHSVVTPRGDTKAALHICSRCWRIKKFKKEHSEASADCPLRGQ